MKKTTLLLSLFVGIIFTTHAQKIKEKDIIGTWKLIINVEEEMEEEAEDADTMLEEVFIKAISGFVGGILEDIEIYFEFKRNNDLKITVNAYGETETEYGTWSINRRGYLEIDEIEGDDFHIEANGDERKMVDGILVSDDHEKDRNVYMAKV
ncbi:MAG: hypothetical protein AAFY41_01215 [Bacteroidota bacterium]